MKLMLLNGLHFESLLGLGNGTSFIARSSVDGSGDDVFVAVGKPGDSAGGITETKPEQR